MVSKLGGDELDGAVSGRVAELGLSDDAGEFGSLCIRLAADVAESRSKLKIRILLMLMKQGGCPYSKLNVLDGRKSVQRAVRDLEEVGVVERVPSYQFTVVNFSSEFERGVVKCVLGVLLNGVDESGE